MRNASCGAGWPSWSARLSDLEKRLATVHIEYPPVIVSILTHWDYPPAPRRADRRADSIYSYGLIHKPRLVLQ